MRTNNQFTSSVDTGNGKTRRVADKDAGQVSGGSAHGHKGVPAGCIIEDHHTSITSRFGVIDLIREIADAALDQSHRIKVRLFGGVDLPANPENAKVLAEQGYELVVPMGGDLGSIGAAPTFTVHALKDPDGANLDRIQIIKGWVDKDGETHELIIEVAWSDGRQRDKDGKLTATEKQQKSRGLSIIIEDFPNDPREGWVDLDNKGVVYNNAHPFNANFSEKNTFDYNLTRVVISSLIKYRNDQVNMDAKTTLEYMEKILHSVWQ